MNTYNAGWALPVLGVGTGSNAKAHYYGEGFSASSLCGRYTMLGGKREDFAHDSPDNCAKCHRVLAKVRPELGLSVPDEGIRVEVTETVRGADGWTYAIGGQRARFHGDVATLRESAEAGRSVTVTCYVSRFGKAKGKMDAPAASLRVLP